MKFSKFVSRRHFCLKNSNLEFNLEWDNLEKRQYKPDLMLGTYKFPTYIIKKETKDSNQHSVDV